MNLLPSLLASPPPPPPLSSIQVEDGLWGEKGKRKRKRGRLSQGLYFPTVPGYELGEGDPITAAGMSDPKLHQTDQYKGWLNKWTNYLKGYQRRWFVLQNDGLLSYYRWEKQFSNERLRFKIVTFFFMPVVEKYSKNLTLP